tara:strand:- start:7963 stop:9597 length:1635 start_codon:yes stop_codon:yes gene_type:complete
MIRVLLLLFLFSSVTYSSNELDSLLVILEQEMLKQNDYDNLKELKIENLKKLLSDKNITPENKYFIVSKIIAEYEYYSFDSTLYYIEQNLSLAKEIGNGGFEKETMLRLSKLLARSGRYKESIDKLNEIDRNSLPKELLKGYYYNYKEIYSELSFYSKVKSNKQLYTNLYAAYKDSLLAYVKPNSLDYLSIKEKDYRDSGNLDKALQINSQRLALAKMGTRDFSIAAFERSYTSAWFYGNSLEQKKYLILSAISDIKGSVKDNASLTSLAVLLFEEGNVDKAHDYIDFSFEDAKFYNSQLRFLNISNVLPVISKSYENISLLQKAKLKRLLIFISFLSIILVVALISIFMQYKKLGVARNELKMANTQLKDLNDKLSFTNKDLKRLYEELSVSDRIKEHYIGTFLNLYSDYINKLDTYRKMVKKYIITNKTGALLELTKSKQVIEKELHLFYENFDKSFLHIYPNFVEELNALLLEDKKITVKEGKGLNTELRIFALIRLGITNSSKISKILRYSVNTIYNYRVKIRNGAINREEFENMVKKIT